MNILSKQLLYKPQTPTVETYEAYYINNGTMTLLGDVTDLSKTFAPPDEFIYSNVFVFDGDLYTNGSRTTTGRNITSVTGRTTDSNYYGYFIENGALYKLDTPSFPISSNTNFIKVCGYGSVAALWSRTYSGFIDASDGLYQVYATSYSQISTLTGWTKITGYGHNNNTSYYGYGIHNGALYYLYANGNGVVQQGTDTTWTDITGSYENGSWYGYGINDGKLYALSGTPTQIGSDTNWTKVSGTASSSAYALGINGGKLYRISGTTATQLGSATDWLDCSGFATSGYYGLAIASDGLYTVSNSGGRTRISSLTDWVYVGGTTGSNAYAVAIRRK